jgi:hypothetical protein
MRWTRIACWFIAAVVQAGPSSMGSISNLTARAGAIVVGSIHSEVSNSAIRFTIHADRVLKGNVRAPSRIVFTWTPPSKPYPGPLPDAYGLCFLERAPDGAWQPLPVANGDISWGDAFLAMPPGGAPAMSSPGSTALDRVLAEIVAAIDRGARVGFDLVFEFRAHRSPVLSAAFRRYQAQSDPYRRMMGLRGAISAGDVNALRTVRDRYVSIIAAPWGSDIVNEIRWYFLNTDPAAIQVLGEMAVDSRTPLDLRVASAAALGKMHTKGALPFLAKLLDEPSYALKAAGVGGLSAFANNVPVGSHEPASGAWIYRTDETIAHSIWDENLVSQRESYYVGFWKAWWQKYRQELLPKHNEFPSP